MPHSTLDTEQMQQIMLESERGVPVEHSKVPATEDALAFRKKMDEQIAEFKRRRPDANLHFSPEMPSLD